MIELIILGFVLFIAGVAGTIAYDKHKEIKTKRAEELASRPAPAPRKRAAPKTMQDMNEEFLAKFAESVKTKPRTSVRKSKPLTQKDLSTQSTLTVEELIAKLEDMKRKL